MFIVYPLDGWGNYQKNYCSYFSMNFFAYEVQRLLLKYVRREHQMDSMNRIFDCLVAATTSWAIKESDAD